MPKNLGNTSLKHSLGNANTMREFDRLPVELRRWLASAALPWRPRSVRRAFEKALARKGTVPAALDELDRRQNRLIAKDARKVWGEGHPNAAL